MHMSTAFQAGSLLVALLAGWSNASALTTPRQSTGEVFTNPIVWEDLPDLDVSRVGDVFYYSSSTFAYSPGAPVYKSYDLVNWTPVSHSVPTLDFGPQYNLDSPTNRAYVQGIWASTLRYRESTDTFYWIGCIQSNQTYIFTSTGSNAGSNGGEASSWAWKQAAVLNTCYYDCGLLIDDDDTMYVVYGATDLSVAQLSADGLSEVSSQVVYSSGGTYIEGSHLYKINGYYWIMPTKPATGEWVLRSTSIWGPYEQQVLFDSLVGPLPNAGFSHQGGIVNTQDDEWYYVAFMDSYPSGRIPVLAPLTWSSDGWPQLALNSSGSWGTSYPAPISTTQTVPALTGLDSFVGTTLSEEWEWNHNPDTTKWSLAGGDGGLILETATVTDDLFSARNTLTHRIIGPKSEAIFEFDVSQMADGDRAGAALFRDYSAYIGIWKSGSTTTLVYVTNIDLDADWNTESTGDVSATGPVVTSSTIYLRIVADVTPAFGLDPVRQAAFSYSMDGSTWTQLGGPFLLNDNWTYFTGYRYAAFNFATLALGGQVTLKSFSMELTS